MNLRSYNNDIYKPGSTLKRTLWYFINMFIFKTMFPFSSKMKVAIVKNFGAKIGNRVLIKPNYPWFVEIGSDVWIGAKSVVCPDVMCSKDSILSIGSIATSDLKRNSVYQRNPVIKKEI